MGSVKVDLYSKGLFYRNLTLSDINVVRLLIEFRYKYDNYLYSVANNMFDVAGEIQAINEDMLITYADLDQVIGQCNFSDEQLKIIKLVEHGYTHKEIANKLGFESNSNIKKRINTICKKISKQNLWNWRKVYYQNVLELKNKNCSKCRNEFPATEEFFSPSNQSIDGYFGYCKKCR